MRIATSLCISFGVAAASTRSLAQIPMSDFIGLNGHAGWTATDSITQHVPLYAQAAKLCRDYHPMRWDVSTPGNNATFPMTTNGLNWKTTYTAYSTGGFSTNMCLQFEGFDQTAWPSMEANAYKYGQQVAQYFGPSGAGAGLVSSIEIGNEPGSYSDANYVKVVRSMSQAIRDYAPAMPIVSCNLTVGASGTYSKSVDLFRTHNMLDLVDVLTIHTYPLLTGWPTWERSYPEDPRLSYLTDVQALIDWRDQYAPTKQVWVTEFGYDATTKPNQPSGTFQDIKMVTDEQQAQWLTRSYLAFARMGVDRAYMYYYNDSDTPTLHAASGLTRNFIPKPSYYAMQHLQQTLGDYAFSHVVSEEVGLYVYAFTEIADPTSIIWVAWRPDGSGEEQLVTLDNLPGLLSSAELMPQSSGLAPSVPYTVLSGGRIRLSISGSPTYLRMQTIPEPTMAALLAVGGAGFMMRRRR